MLFIELAKVQLFIHSIRRVVLGGYGIPAIPTHPSFPTLAPLFLPLHALLSLVHPISFPLHTPYFCHPHRPTRMLVSTDADARNDRRRCSYRPTRMTFVDVSCCQTFTFAVSNLYFHYVKPLLLRFKTSLFTFYTLFFFPYLPLFFSISSAFLLCASSGCSP